MAQLIMVLWASPWHQNLCARLSCYLIQVNLKTL